MKQKLSEILATETRPTQSVMAIMIPYDDPTLPAGDYKVVWDRTKEDEVAHARETFAKWRRKGYMAYSVSGKNAEKGQILHDFDPEAQSIIFAPPLQGGSCHTPTH